MARLVERFRLVPVSVTVCSVRGGGWAFDAVVATTGFDERKVLLAAGPKIRCRKANMVIVIAIAGFGLMR